MATKPSKTASKAKPATAAKPAAKKAASKPAAAKKTTASKKAVTETLAVAKPVLSDVRAKIDQIDRSIQALIAERANFSTLR